MSVACKVVLTIWVEQIQLFTSTKLILKLYLKVTFHSKSNFTIFADHQYFIDTKYF